MANTKNRATSTGTKRKQTDSSYDTASASNKRLKTGNAPVFASSAVTKRKRKNDEPKIPERESKRIRQDPPEFGILLNNSTVEPKYLDAQTGEVRKITRTRTAAPPPPAPSATPASIAPTASSAPQASSAAPASSAPQASSAAPASSATPASSAPPASSAAPEFSAPQASSAPPASATAGVPATSGAPASASAPFNPNEGNKNEDKEAQEAAAILNMLSQGGEKIATPPISTPTPSEPVVKTLVAVFLKKNPSEPAVLDVVPLSPRQFEEMIAYREDCQSEVLQITGRYDYIHFKPPPSWVDKWSPDTPQEIARGIDAPVEGSRKWRKQSTLAKLESYAAKLIKYDIPDSLSYAERTEAFDQADLYLHVTFEEKLLSLNTEFPDFESLGDGASLEDRLAMLRAYPRDIAFSLHEPGTISEGLEQQEPQDPNRSYEVYAGTLSDATFRSWKRSPKWADRHRYITTGSIPTAACKYIAEHRNEFTATERDICLQSLETQKYKLEYRKKDLTQEGVRTIEALKKRIMRKGRAVGLTDEALGWLEDYYRPGAVADTDAQEKENEEYLALLDEKAWDAGRARVAPGKEAEEVAQAERWCVERVEKLLMDSSEEKAVEWERNRIRGLWKCNKWHGWEADLKEESA